MNKLRLILLFAAVAVVAGCTPKEHKIAIVAHQGYWDCDEAYHLGNTVAALVKAQEEGFWGSEFDVHITGDDNMLVFHNADIFGIDIHNTPLDTLTAITYPNGLHPASLDEFLTQAEKCTTTKLVFELKPHPEEERENLFVDRAIEALNAHGLYDPKRVMFISFSLNMCKKIAEKCPKFDNQYLAGDIDPDDLFAMGINGVDYHFSFFYQHPEWIEHARNHNMSLNIWTVDNPEDLQRVIDMAPDAITTNVPVLLREMLGERELKNK
ncbi:MAG: hypothetical protein J6X89_01225 [Bacteroidales bacterium]|nr:hypothetical protein [Bacteroidales bacterium]